MFCPFVNGECREDCVFRCKHEEPNSQLTQSPTKCLLVKRMNSLNYMQESQLNDILEAISVRE